MNVAQLTIEMAANVARLKTDMASARNTVDSTMNSIRKSASLAATALGAIGVGLSVNAFAGWVKNAINAADETNKLAQKIGIAVEEIGGLQLAFQQGGVNAESMQKSLAKLNVNIANGDAAFKALGVSTKNIDGSLRSTTSVLIDIADRFASTQDGAAKTAMAMEIFGKSGADLVPVLNAGGESIRQFNILADQLGLTLDGKTAASAERFNDTLELIGLASRGVANQLMAELLPTMESLAGEFFTLINSGNNLQDVASYIAMALKGLFTVVAGGVEIMRSLLIMTEMTAKVMMAFGSLDFKGAMGVFEETEKRLKENWGTTLGSIDRLWNKTGNTAVEAAAKIVKGTMQSTKSMEDAEKAAKKLADEQEKSLQSAAALLNAITFETETQQMSNVEREIAINLRKLEATGLEENTALYNAYAEAIKSATIDNEAIKERIKLEEEAAKKTQKIAEDYAKEMDQINNQIGQSLTDALVNGGRSAKEFLIDMFRTLILRPILQPIITGGTGAVMAALGMGGSGNAMASGGGAAGAFNIMGAVKTAYDAVAGGFMALGTQAAFAAEAMGSWLVTNTTGYLNSLGGSMMANSGAIGSFTSGAAGIGAGIMAGEFISGGRSVVGGNSLYTTGGGAAAGAALGTFVFPGVGTAIGGLVGGIVGGVVNAAFGSGAKQTTGQSIQGTLTTQGLMDARSATSWSKKGGWFGGGGSGKDFQAISAGLQEFMDDALISVTNAARGYADILGISSESLANATHYFEIPANSAEEATKYLEGELKGYANLLAKTLLVGTNYARENESAIDTLARLATSINTVNSLFKQLGFGLYETSLSGANAANVLVELMGGFDSFSQTMDFFYQNFYTQAEKTAKATENLTAVFESMGIAMQGSREQFRALVDAASASGNPVLLANLLKLAPAFLEITKAAEQANEAIIQQRNQLIARINQMTGSTEQIRNDELNQIDESNRALLQYIYAMEDAAIAQQNAAAAYQFANQAVSDAVSNLRSAIDAEVKNIELTISNQLENALSNLKKQFSDLTNSINSEIDALQNKKSSLTDVLSSIKTIFDFLSNQVYDLMGALRPFETASQGFTFVAQALLTAQRTGVLPDQAQLQRAVGAARTGLGGESFGSAFEMQKANAQFVNNLIQLQKIAGNQQTFTEDQIEKTDQQIELLKLQLEQAKQQYEDEVVRVREFYDAQIKIQTEQLSVMIATRFGINNLGTGINGLNDGILGVSGGVLSVGTAIQNLSSAMSQQQTANAALFAAQKAAAEAAAKSASAAAAAAAAAAASVKEKPFEMTPLQSQIDLLYQNILGRKADMPGLLSWSSSGKNIAQIESEIYGSTEYRRIQIEKMYKDILKRDADAPGLTFWMKSTLGLEEIATSLKQSEEGKLLGYADGGFYPGGMALVGEQGPELINFNRPGQVYTASETGKIMSGDNGNTEEVRQLRLENQAQSRSIVLLQSRMTRILERWDGDGIPSQRYEGATA